MSGPLTRGVADKAREVVRQWPEVPGLHDVETLLRVLAKWRSQVLGLTYQSHHGPTIMGGLFAGMTYLDETAEGSLISRMLGTYEAALQPHIQAIIDEGVDCVLDVGCAEGYYAVGIARRWPALTVHAFDIDPRARAKCAELAARNGVSDRVIIGEAFKPEDFEAYAGRRTLVLVDAEGAELDILQPALGPALAGMSVVVETHDVWRPGALAELKERFQPSHDIVQVDGLHGEAALPDWLLRLSELDQLLAQWEWRHRLTPWLVMRPKA
ncbi:class I SAM-dependent methyltransferase [Phenylobacterium sp.]|jgi:precorrin-6B methylase 2|uniref:class I SAM-dependent methyltransferase n=1 Tax=Phenylobacterium sp. TaxID=1871053 RepID=UPI002F9223B2